MSFKTLEQRFNEKVNQLYAAGNAKFENGRASRGANDDPLIVRKPGDGYWTRAESRATPISSTLNDVKRLTLFTLSVRGVSFLAKQQLLQTGNTFESTRIINPAFVLANAVPFVHVKRALDIPITAGGIGRQLLGGGALANKIFGSGGQKTDSTALRKIGQLQQETYDKYVKSSPTVKTFIQKIPIIGKTVSAASAKRSMGEVGDGWKNSRPELGNNDSGYVMYGKLTDWNNNRQTVASDTNTLLGKLFSLNPAVRAMDLIKYGPLKNNGKYTTYLLLGSDQKSWTRPRNITDYTKYISKNYKQLTNARYFASVEELSGTGKESKLETTKYKRGASEKELDRRIKDGDANLKKRLATTKYERSELERSIDEEITEYVQVDVERSDAYRELPRPNVLADGAPVYATYQGKQFIKYFSAGTAGMSSVTDAALKDGTSTNMKDKVDSFRAVEGGGKKITYIKDESNLPALIPNQRVPQQPYQLINNHFDDPIVVSFAMGNGGHVRFRAFIKDLTEAVNPQYTPYQYIGRIEKFINYTGVQREVSFKLAVLAFGEEELEGVWRKINYLTGLAFPYGFTNGIMQPNIARLTIGNVYVNQPGYISSLNKNFNEPSETWEILMGRQVPIGATMDIRFTLIEKSTKIAESPFYGITEEMDGFSKTLNIPEPVSSPETTNTTTVPTNTSIPVPAVPTNTIPNRLFPSDSARSPLGFLATSSFGGFNTSTRTNIPANTGPFPGFGGGGFSGGGGGSTW